MTVIDHRALRVPSNKNAACGKKIDGEGIGSLLNLSLGLFGYFVRMLSSAILIPSRKAYSKMAASDRLAYSLQHFSTVA